MARPKGSTGSKHTFTIMGGINADVLERIATQYENDATMLTPLDIFVAVMSGKDKNGNPVEADWNLKIDAATKAAPYFHWKMPAAIEVTGQDGGPIESATTVHLKLMDILFGGPVQPAIEAEPVKQITDDRTITLTPTESRLPEKA